MTNLIFPSVVATFTLVSGCGGQADSNTQSTNPAAAGGAPGGVGGSSAGSGGVATSTGGAATASGGASAGAAAGGSGGAVAAGMGGGAGTSPAGNGGGGGTCPDYQSGFSGGPAMPELAPEGPSCAGGLTCAGRSCCEAVRVKGGLLKLGAVCTQGCGDPDSWCPPGSDVDGEVPIQVTDTTIDTFLVTVGRFRKFVSAYTGAPIAPNAGADPNVPASGWSNAFNKHLLPTADALRTKIKCDPAQATQAMWTDEPGPNEDKAMNCVDWFHAFAFCIWDGGWLPIEAQWEYVAAGGAEDRKFPWGQTEPDATLVAPSPCPSAPGPCTIPMSVGVGSRPAGQGKWGHQDLQGYIAQWMQDVDHHYVALKNPGMPFKSGCDSPGEGTATGVDCYSWWDGLWQETGGADIPIVRGVGAIGFAPDSLRAADRGLGQPDLFEPYIGLRCARP